MSIKANLELDNGDLETIEIEDTEYEIDFLKKCASQGKILCGGHNEDGDICEARLFIREKRNHSSFAKYPSSEKRHIKNCSRQKVETRQITYTSLQKYNEFLEKLLNGLFESDDITDDSPTTSTSQSHIHSGGRGGNSAVNLKKIDNLVRAILRGDLELTHEISEDYKLYNFFRTISRTSSIIKFMDANNKERYHYILIKDCRVTSSGNLHTTLLADSETVSSKLFINSNFEGQLNNNKTYDILIIANGNDFEKDLWEHEYGVTPYYKITLPKNRILVRLKKRNGSSLVHLINMIKDIHQP